MQLTMLAQTADHTHIAVEGKIYGFFEATTDPFETVLGPNPYSHNVILNLEKSTQIDSSGIGWLVTSFKRFREQGRQFILHSQPPLVANVIKLVMLEKIVECAADYADAVRRLQAKLGKS